jgi:hypothetical protein
MIKQADPFFRPMTEADWAAMRLTDDDLDKLLAPCVLTPFDGTVNALDGATAVDKLQAGQPHASGAQAGGALQV